MLDNGKRASKGYVDIDQANRYFSTVVTIGVFAQATTSVVGVKPAPLIPTLTELMGIREVIMGQHRSSSTKSWLFDSVTAP